MQLLLLILGFFLNDGSLSQCTCMPISVRQNIEKSTLIFTGKVVKVDTVELYEEGLPELSYREGRLAFVELYSMLKGQANFDTVIVITGAGHGDCGYNFIVNTDYLIYAKKKEYNLIDSTNYEKKLFYTTKNSIYTTTICDRTTRDLRKEEIEVRKILKEQGY